MKRFYKIHDFLPATSYYDQTVHTLEREFKDCLGEAKKYNKIMVVKSSGTNLKVNQLVAEHEHIIILVVTPLDIVNKRIKKEKKPEFDPETLNNSILKGQLIIYYDFSYFLIIKAPNSLRQKKENGDM